MKARPALRCWDLSRPRQSWHAPWGPTAVQLDSSSVGERQPHGEAAVQGMSPYTLLPELVTGAWVSHPERELRAHTWEPSATRTRTATAKLHVSPGGACSLAAPPHRWPQDAPRLARLRGRRAGGGLQRGQVPAPK